jgi:hypothetical protein
VSREIVADVACLHGSLEFGRNAIDFEIDFVEMFRFFALANSCLDVTKFDLMDNKVVAPHDPKSRFCECEGLGVRQRNSAGADEIGLESWNTPMFPTNKFGWPSRRADSTYIQVSLLAEMQVRLAFPSCLKKQHRIFFTGLNITTEFVTMDTKEEWSIIDEFTPCVPEMVFWPLLSKVTNKILWYVL